MTNNPNNNNKNYMSSHMAMTGSGAVKRIRTPAPTDVLLGRGGGINSHVGNRVFRDWVRDRKEDYNLAGSKAEKTRVAKDVMDLVRNQSPPGRFLLKDPTSSAHGGWWVEVDEVRALAKTSQALREGAPTIRATHQGKKPTTSRKRKSSSSKIKPVVPAAAGTTWPPPPPQLPQPQSFNNTNNNNNNNEEDEENKNQMGHPRDVSSGTQRALNELNRNLMQAKSIADQNGGQPNAPLPAWMTELNFDDDQGQQQEQQQQPQPPPLPPPQPARKRPRFVEPNNSSSNVTEVPDVPPIPQNDIAAHRSMGAPVPPAPSNAPPPVPNKDQNQDFSRAHSLALSDLEEQYDHGDPGNPQDDFINPFLNEEFGTTSISSGNKKEKDQNKNNKKNINLVPASPQPVKERNNASTKNYSVGGGDVGDASDSGYATDTGGSNTAAPDPGNMSSESTSNSKDDSMVHNVSSDEGREEYSRLGEMYSLPPNISDKEDNHDDNNNNSSDHRQRTYSDSTMNDFHDELRSMMDAIHANENHYDQDVASPDLASKGDYYENNNSNNNDNGGMPTLLLPWRGGALQRRYGSNGALKNNGNSNGGGVGGGSNHGSNGKGNGGSTPRTISISDIINERQ